MCVVQIQYNECQVVEGVTNEEDSINRSIGVVSQYEEPSKPYKENIKSIKGEERERKKDLNE